MNVMKRADTFLQLVKNSGRTYHYSCLAFPISSLQALLSGARMNVSARINSGAAISSPITGNINKPVNTNNELTNNIMNPTTRVDTFSLMQSFFFIVSIVDLLIYVFKSITGRLNGVMIHLNLRYTIN